MFVCFVFNIIMMILTGKIRFFFFVFFFFFFFFFVFFFFFFFFFEVWGLVYGDLNR